MADKDRVQKGWGLTNDTIKLIASDQIATLLPLVDHATQHFGFVINYQSFKKPECIGELFTLIGRKQYAVSLTVQSLSRQKRC